MKKVILGLGILLVGGATMFAGMSCGETPSEKPKHCKSDEFMKMKNRELAKELNLTSEQLSRLDGLVDKMKSEIKPPMPPRENPLAKYTINGAFDKTAFESDMINKDKERAKAMGEFFSNLVAILTPEQRAKLKDLKFEEKHPPRMI